MLFLCGHEFFDDDLPACPVCCPKKHKYKAKPVKTDDGYFHSTGEYNRWCELKILAQCGEITELERQVRFKLQTIRQTYIVDFTYKEVIDGKNQKVAEDFKGAITSEYRRKKEAFQREQKGYLFRETKRRETKKRRSHGFKAAKRKDAAS